MLPSHTAHTRVPQAPMQDIFNFSQLLSLLPFYTHTPFCLSISWFSFSTTPFLALPLLSLYLFLSYLTFISLTHHSFPPSFLLIAHTHTYGSCFTHIHDLGVDFWVFFWVFSSQSSTRTLTAQISLSPSASPSLASRYLLSFDLVDFLWVLLWFSVVDFFCGWFFCGF